MSGPRQFEWKFNPPPNRNELVWLLTLMGIAVKGHWTGAVGEHFNAWDEI